MGDDTGNLGMPYISATGLAWHRRSIRAGFFSLFSLLLHVQIGRQSVVTVIMGFRQFIYSSQILISIITRIYKTPSSLPLPSASQYNFYLTELLKPPSRRYCGVFFFFRSRILLPSADGNRHVYALSLSLRPSYNEPLSYTPKPIWLQAMQLDNSTLSGVIRRVSYTIFLRKLTSDSNAFPLI